MNFREYCAKECPAAEIAQRIAEFKAQLEVAKISLAAARSTEMQAKYRGDLAFAQQQIAINNSQLDMATASCSSCTKIS